MGIMIDILGAAVIGGTILVAILGTVVNINQTSQEQTFALGLQRNAVQLAKMLESDLVKMGYRAPGPAIFVADSNRLEFASDLMNDGTIRTVRYTTGDPNDSLAQLTQNPRDFILRRQVSGQSTLTGHWGLTALRFTYYDSLGHITDDRTMIRSIHVWAYIESLQPVDTVYPGAFWSKVIYPRNLD